jgi:DNA-binding IclR family transcriptional regulator
MPKERSYLTQSVERAIALLAIIAENDTRIGLSELAERAGLHSSTAHRLLATLIAHSYVYQDQNDKTYSLGPALIRLGEAARSQIDIIAIARDQLNELAERVGELVNLVVLEGDQAMYVYQSQGRPDSVVRMFTRIGALVPLHCTGVGKAMLAHLPEDKREQVFEKGFKAYTKNTITNELKLLSELEIIRERGYATDLEEREVGVHCVATPILDSTGQAIAAVSVSGPAGRVTADRLPELGALVRETAGWVSMKLGYRQVDA